MRNDETPAEFEARVQGHIAICSFCAARWHKDGHLPHPTSCPLFKESALRIKLELDNVRQYAIEHFGEGIDSITSTFTAKDPKNVAWVQHCWREEDRKRRGVTLPPPYSPRHPGF